MSSEYLAFLRAEPARPAVPVVAALLVGAVGGWLLRRWSSGTRPLQHGLAAGVGGLTLALLAREGLKLRRAAETSPAVHRGRGPVTQATVPVMPADRSLDTPGRNLDHRLDEALEESFPASDPISVHIE